MGQKKVGEIIFKNGELHPPAVRGTIEAWIDRKEEFNYDEERGTIPVSYENGVAEGAFLDWLEFLGRKVEEDLYDEFRGTDVLVDMGSIFQDYWNDNDELRERFKDIAYWCKDASILMNISSAEEQGGIDKLLEEHGKQAIATAVYEGRDKVNPDDQDSGDSDEDSHKDQSSFGAGRFPELHGVGVIDDDANVVDSKLRGLVLAVLKDVDEIRGEDRYLEVEWVQRAFLQWGLDRWEDEWMDFAVKCTSGGEIYDAVSWLHINNEDARVQMEKLYNGNFEMELGNRNTNDATKSFLDAEAPGWDEDDDDEGDAEDTSKWEQFEEEAEELEGTAEKTREEDEGGQEESKWDRFEEESKERDTTDRRNWRKQ